jgi:hypothetical protein
VVLSPLSFGPDNYREAVARLSLVGEALPGCHVDEGDIYSRQLSNEYQDTSTVGMTTIKNIRIKDPLFSAEPRRGAG